MTALLYSFAWLIALAPVWIVGVLVLLDRAADKKAEREYAAECAQHKIALAAWYRQWTNSAEPTTYRTGPSYAQAGDGRPRPMPPAPPNTRVLM